MKRSIHWPLLGLFAVALLLSQSVNALGLGRLTVFSASGQPLKAEVDLVNAKKEELASLKVQMANRDIYRQYGIEYPAFLEGIRVQVDNRADGSAFLRLASNTPIQDTFLDILIDAQWAGGRSVKEYTFLLDAPGAASTASNSGQSSPIVAMPPVVAPPPPALPTPLPVVASKTEPNKPAAPGAKAATPDSGGAANAPSDPLKRFAASLNAGNAKAPAPAASAAASPPPAFAPLPPSTPELAAESKKKPVAAAKAEKPRSAENTAASAGGDTAQVAQGDSISKLVMARGVAGESVNRTIMAVFKANPSAFIKANVNLVKAGVTLQWPSEEDIAKVSAAAASKDLAEHRMAWMSFRNQLGQATTAAASVPTMGADKPAPAPAQSSATGSVKKPQEAPVAAAEAKDMLVVSQKGSATAAKDDATALQKTLAENEQRAAQLKENIAMMEQQTAAASVAAPAPAAPASAMPAITAPAVANSAKNKPTFSQWLRNNAVLFGGVVAGSLLALGALAFLLKKKLAQAEVMA